MKRRRWLVFALFVILAVAVASLFGVTEVERVAVARARTGQLCADCHASSATHEPHASEPCASCHHVGDDVDRDLLIASLGWRAAPEHGATTECTSCHQDVAGRSEGHRQHSDASCSGCHTSPHEPAAEVSCAGCHDDVAQYGVTAEVTCATCHRFRESAPDAPPEAARPVLASVAPNAHEVGPSRLHGAMDCRRCHDPHREVEATATCDSCHRGALAAEVQRAPVGHRRCADCHQPHASREQPAIDCLGCHVAPRPNAGWEARPGAITEAEREETRAHLTHDGQCGTCHEPHTWVATMARCAECHQENAASVAALPAGTHDSCMTCHEPHSPSPTGAVCASCHQDVHVTVGDPPAAHRDCLSCHDPHAGRPVAAQACATCHAQPRRETLGRPARHQDCLSCHQEHGAPLAGAPCASCHRDPAQAFLGVQVPEAHRCATCHVPHAFLADGAAITRCAGCHSNAVSSHASHRGTCTDCHTEHGAPIGQAASCAHCHANVHPTVEGHSDCSGCHRPHAPASAAIAQCAACHQTEARTAASWPAGSPHAGRCADCHQPHRERPPQRCESCHARQANRSHTGGHSSCVQCHAPHQAVPATWWAACARCHENESRAVARATGTHGDCAACHQIPGPPLPTCVGCHTEMSRRLEHRHHADRVCATCHAPHGPSEIDRDTCTASCHLDRGSHFPDARQCQSCHPFAD